MSWQDNDAANLDRLCIAVEKISESGDSAKLKTERDEAQNKLDSLCESVIRFADRFEATLNADEMNAMQRAKAIRALHSDIYAIARRHASPELLEKVLTDLLRDHSE